MKAFIITGLNCKTKLYEGVKRKFENEFEEVEVLENLGTSFENICLEISKKLVNEEKDFIVVGHCYGGMIALYINAAIVKLKHWKGIITCNSYYDLTKYTLEYMDKAGENLESYEQLKNLKDVTYSDREEEQIKIAMGVNIEKFLKYVDLPVLVLGSDKDGYFEQEQFKDMFYKIGTCCSSVYSIIEGSRHMGIIVDTDKYLGMIKMWKRNNKRCLMDCKECWNMEVEE